jgi:hypothetical protein
MKKKITLALVAIVAVVAMSFEILSPTGKAGKTGAYTEGDCTACHNDYAVNTGSGSIAITSVPALTNGYVPGTEYTVTVTVSYPGDSIYGFDFEALLNATTNGGTISLLSPSVDVKTLPYNTTLTDAVHTGTGNKSLNSHAFSFYWTAPATGTGTVTFYAAGMGTNDDGTGTPVNDWVYTTSKILTQSASGIAEVMAKDFNFSTFPNPATDNLNVKFSLKGVSAVTMDMIDINGKKVANLISENGLNGEINRTYNISSYAKGIYFVRLSINNETTMQKIVVE